MNLDENNGYLLDSKDWIYINEGGQNIIVGYLGEEPHFNRCVLRLRKRRLNVFFINDLIEEKIFSDSVQASIGEQYVNTGELIVLEGTFLVDLSKQIEIMRPEKRKTENIDFSAKYGLLLPDFKVFPGLNLEQNCCIEIKPKCGSIPKYLITLDNDKYSDCRYCMHQEMKLKNNSINSKSKYCPLELYSEDKNKIKKAIGFLIDNPQNNFKILNNSNFFENQNLEKNLMLSKILAKILKKEPILKILKNLQDKDIIGIEGIHYLYFKKKLKNDFSSPIKLDIEKFLNSNFFQKKNFSIDSLISDFLLSSTIKDCSILINICTLEKNEFSFVEVKGTKYYYFLKVIDFDKKHENNIPYYFSLDSKISKFHSNPQKRHKYYLTNYSNLIYIFIVIVLDMPTKLEVITPPEEDESTKKRNKLAKNREAAQQFRERQKSYMDTLSQKVATLEKTNSDLEELQKTLTDENQKVKLQLSQLHNFISQAISLSFPGQTVPTPVNTGTPDTLGVQKLDNFSSLPSSEVPDDSTTPLFFDPNSVNSMNDSFNSFNFNVPPPLKNENNTPKEQLVSAEQEDSLDLSMGDFPSDPLLDISDLEFSA